MQILIGVLVGLVVVYLVFRHELPAAIRQPDFKALTAIFAVACLVVFMSTMNLF